MQQQEEAIRSLETGAFAICAIAGVLAIAILILGGVRIDVASLGMPLGYIGFLVGTYAVYRWWRPDPKIRNICGAFAVMTLAGSAAGIISLAGLRLNFPLVDASLAALDSWLRLDTRPLVTAAANAPAFSKLLGIAYISSFPLLFAAVGILGLKRNARQVWLLAFIFAFTVVGCATLSVMFPAVGAFSHYAHPAHVSNQLPGGAGVYHLAQFEYFRTAAAPVLSMSKLQGVVTFPSLHCCLALMTMFAFVEYRWLFRISLLWNGLVIVSTVPIGGHYFVDLPAGAALWAGGYLLATALWRKHAVLQASRSRLRRGMNAMVRPL